MNEDDGWHARVGRTTTGSPTAVDDRDPAERYGNSDAAPEQPLPVGVSPAVAKPVAPPFGHRFGALLRRIFWRVFLFFTGGVKVDGKLPKGGCVVVANHSSHADTAALMAALDAAHAPRVAAATDYWFAKWPRRLICSVLTGAFPVRRDGGGWTDLRTSAGGLLRAGHAVIIFPEGTRGTGTVGTFHRGASTLAEAMDVPVVPVALCGTGELLPRNGKVNPRPLRVRIGEPMRGASAEEARAEVVALAAAHQERDSRLRQRVARVAVCRWGILLAAAWAFAEAFSWPLLPELLLAILCAAAPRAGMRLTLTAAAASMAGGLLGLALYTGTNVELPQPLTTERMHSTAAEEFREEGARAVRHQPASGNPYKVYIPAAADAKVPAGDFAYYSVKHRGARILLLGTTLTLLGWIFQRWRRFYAYYMVVLGVSFTVLLSMVYNSWT